MLEVMATALARSVVSERRERLTLEHMLTSPEWFGLTTASPLQRAICRICGGEPLWELELDPTVQAALGGQDAVESLPLGAPTELYVVAGIRGGKSLITAARAVLATQMCDLSALGPGDEVRVSCVSLRLDLARVIHSHIMGALQRSARLRALLVTEPSPRSIVLRHPSGRPVEISIVAGARAGGTLVSRWSAGVIFDEAPRMRGDDAVVNFGESRRAVLARLLPGAQLIAVGSPHAPIGDVYETCRESWGRPSGELVVIRAPSPALWPAWWTPERIAHVRATDEQSYRADILAEWVDVSSGAYRASDLDRAIQPWETQPPLPRHHYVAAMDPATRGNGWTLLVGTRLEDETVRVVYAHEWRGSTTDPLSPAAVLREIADIIAPYRVGTVITDQWAADPLRDIAAPLGVHLSQTTISRTNKVQLLDATRSIVRQGRLQLPAVRQLRDDLARVKRTITQGGIRVDYPATADGRHCDYAASLALLVSAAQAPPLEPEPELPPGWTQDELDDADQLAAQATARPGWFGGDSWL